QVAPAPAAALEEAPDLLVERRVLRASGRGRERHEPENGESATPHRPPPRTVYPRALGWRTVCLGAMSSRRSFLSLLSGAAAGTLVAPRRAPALLASDAARPAIPYGAAVGDVTGDGAVVWSCCDRPARMIVEWSTRGSFADLQRQAGPVATAEMG